MKNAVHYRCATAAIFVLAFHVPTWGQIFIDVGSHTLLANTPGQTIEISVFSTPVTPVQGMNFNVQIADGFPKPPGTVVDGPNITAVDILGTVSNPTIFFGNNTGQSWARGDPLDPQVWSVFTTVASGTVNAQGLLGILTIDTTGWFSGNWSLALANTQEGPTDFTLLPATITDGSITVVPEPGSTVLVGSLLFVGALVFRRVRRA